MLGGSRTAHMVSETAATGGIPSTTMVGSNDSYLKHYVITGASNWRHGEAQGVE